FYNSPENRGNQIANFYKYFLGRNAALFEIEYYVKRLQNGEDEGVIMQDFILSPEFTGRTSNTQFVNTMYYAILGRGALGFETDFYKTRLDSGAMTRAQVLQAFLRSPEGIDRVVASDFVSYLEREPTAGELSTYEG